MVAIKDTNNRQHAQLENIPNLQVIKAMQSLKSRSYVNEQFAWRHYYWYLNNEGIQYLRDYLHLPPEIVPATLKRQTRPEAARARPKVPDAPRPSMGADRAEYRRGGPGGADKKGDVGAGATENFQFRGGFGGGFGRGAPRQQPPQ